MLTVHKIGGTSMSKFEDVMNNIVRGPGTEKDPYNRIFVVSAYSGVTNCCWNIRKPVNLGCTTCS